MSSQRAASPERRAAARCGAAAPSGPGRDPDALAVVARDVVADERARLGGGGGAAGVDTPRRRTSALASAAFADPLGSGLTTVLNATGVILHTNLGRAPWPAAAIEAAARAAAGYSLLELDREAGRRGARFRAAEDHLIALTGAEDALVTNNNAAALALAVGLAGAARRRRLARRARRDRRRRADPRDRPARRARGWSRSGRRTGRARPTSTTPLADGRATVVLRVHPSNFAQAGFIEAPDPAEVARIAHEHGAIVVDDLGSGALLDTARYGLAHEPMPAERLAAGADLVTFSGDKLVGGPQAGLIVGRADLIARMRRDPLARAIRPEKVTLAALAATLGLYRAGRATTRIPVWRMIATTPTSCGAGSWRSSRRCRMRYPTASRSRR